MHPADRRLPVEAHADVGVAAQRRPHLGAEERRTTTRSADQIPEDDRDYYLERLYPSFGNLAPRDIASRAAKRAVDAGRGVGPLKNGVYLDFADAIDRLGKDVIEERYGNLFEMYERITGEDPYEVPMRIYPAIHYTMGGLWVDYELMTTIPGLYCAGEANFSDHGANRLGASALMQGLADGYFVLPYTIGNYLAAAAQQAGARTDHPEFPGCRAGGRPTASSGYLAIGGTRSPDYFHRELGKIIWDYCGMERNASRASRRRCRRSPRCTRSSRRTSRHRPTTSINQTLEKAGPGRRLLRARHADVPRRARPRGELRRPLPRRAPDRGRRGAARRRELRPRRRLGVDRRPDRSPIAHKEPLEFEVVHLATRSYK